MRISPILSFCFLLLPGLAGGGNLILGSESEMLPAPEEYFQERTYIVQLKEPPAVAYGGGIGGMPATRAAEAEEFKAMDGHVQRYAEHLTNRHDEMLRSVGAYHNKVYSYRYTFNGFAARLSQVQVQKLRNRRDVLKVWQDRVRYLSTNDSAGFLGLLDGDTGLRSSLGMTGEDVIIGVIDSGITPEHPSFADVKEGNKPRVCRRDQDGNRTAFETTLLGLFLCARFRDREEVMFDSVPDRWNGACETGDDFDVGSCNNKLIGARYYLDGFVQEMFLDENEILSPRDADGHGTHISSTAAGNPVRAKLFDRVVDDVSGIAPRARVAMYKACWLEPGQTRGSCAVSDLQRAIEDAVADGVDVINYSVGDDNASLIDPDDLALLAAAEAGVLAVVAAGNDGPAEGSILSPGGTPWVLTVGASSRRGTKFQEAIRLVLPESLAGEYAVREASFTPPLTETGEVTGQLILVDDGIEDGEQGTTWDACETILNTDEISGKIAFIQRGVCDFELKVTNAEEAGAAAVVVFNNQGAPIIMGGTRDSVDIPAVMLSQSDGQLILDRILADDTVELTLDKSIFLDTEDDGNRMGSFSARGPNLSAPDILKPDVTAPGVDILAGHTPDVANGIRGEQFQYLSGTSMSAPQVAGLAALIKQLHPEWSPAAIKSSLMTTARQDVLTEEGEPTTPFDLGAGHVVPNQAADPGLIYETSGPEYTAFTCGTPTPRVSEAECEALAGQGLPTDPVDLNLPSIGIGELVGEREIRRTVTGVGNGGQYRASLDLPAGISGEVDPSIINIQPGEEQEFSISLSQDGSQLFEWQFGSLTWESDTRRVRSPIAVFSTPLSAPPEIAGNGSPGDLSLPLTFGYSGNYQPRVLGLSRPDRTPSTVEDDPLNSYFFLPFGEEMPAYIRRLTFNVGQNVRILQFGLFDDFTDGNDDLDLYVYRCVEELNTRCDTVEVIGVSGSDTSDEQVGVVSVTSDRLVDPGTYIVDIHGFDVDPEAGGPGSTFELFFWQIRDGEQAGNLTATGPAGVSPGQDAQIDLRWQGLMPDIYLGGIAHENNGNLLDLTVVSIDGR